MASTGQGGQGCGASHTTVPKLTLKFLAPLFEVGCLVRKGHGTQTAAPSNIPPTFAASSGLVPTGALWRGLLGTRSPRALGGHVRPSPAVEVEAVGSAGVPVLPSFLCADLEVCCLQGSPCPRGELSGGRHGCASSFAFVACCTAAVCARVCSNTANVLPSYWGCQLASQKLLFIFVFQFLFSLVFSLSLSTFIHSFKVNL